MVNSAVYLTGDGQEVPGMIDERDGRSIVFRAEDGRELLRAPYAAIDKVKLPFPSRSRMTFVVGAEQHRVKLTGDVVEDVRITNDMPLPSGAQRTDATREERAADDAGTLILGLSHVITFVGADRVRRRRIRKRVTQSTAPDNAGSAFPERD